MCRRFHDRVRVRDGGGKPHGGHQRQIRCVIDDAGALQGVQFQAFGEPLQHLSFDLATGVLSFDTGDSPLLGLGEGGEANAPLGRAVIGGLAFSTNAALMFVPVVFSMLHKKRDAKGVVLPETVNVH